MAKRLAICCIALFAAFAAQTSAQEKQALRLVQTIPLPGVKGRLDHMGVDLEQKRLFVAAVANNTLEVVDLTAGKVIKSLAGFKDTQDALFLGGDFNKLYVSSLARHCRRLRTCSVISSAVMLTGLGRATPHNLLSNSRDFVLPRSAYSLLEHFNGFP